MDYPTGDGISAMHPDGLREDAESRPNPDAPDMNAEPRSNPVRCVVCLHAMTWADSARSAMTATPVGTAHPDHQPIVPTAGGVPPYCTCGWRSARFPKPGELLADHLKKFDSTYGQS